MASDIGIFVELFRDTIREYAEESVGNDGSGEVDEPFVASADIKRFFARYGLIERKAAKENLLSTLDKIAAATNSSRRTIERVIGIFCSSDGAPEKAVCSSSPRCMQCPLKEHCKFNLRKPSIKQLPAEERPRERLVHEGEAALSNAELLGIIIGGGTIEETAVDLARRLLKQYGTLRRLGNMTIGELQTIKGIGRARAAQISAAFALARRLMGEGTLQLDKRFHSSRAIFDFMHAELRDLKKEVFRVLLLDSKNQLIKIVQVSEGSLSSSIVHPREVYNPVIRESASAVVFVHNHPSGDPEPSQEDDRVTARLKEAGELIGIRVLDHIIVGDGRYYSYLDEGKL